VVIEVNGNQWHANPDVYDKDDLIKTWDGLLTAQEIWERDDCRKKQIESFGYDVIILWETDIRKNINEIKEMLCKRLLSSQ
jgi:very-short-patch-repair endonuclease